MLSNSLRVPWTARRSNQSTRNEINLQYSLEGWMLKLKLQYFGYLMQRANSLKKTLMLGKTESRRGRGRQRMRWLDSIIDSMDMSLRNSEMVKNREAWQAAIHGSQRIGHDLAAEQPEKQYRQSPPIKDHQEGLYSVLELLIITFIIGNTGFLIKKV